MFKIAVLPFSRGIKVQFEPNSSLNSKTELAVLNFKGVSTEPVADAFLDN